MKKILLLLFVIAASKLSAQDCVTPAVSAGQDKSICGVGTMVKLEGTVTGATGATWSTSGSGSFSDPNSLVTMYMPSAADNSAGSVAISLTSKQVRNCPTASDNLMIAIVASCDGPITAIQKTRQVSKLILFPIPSDDLVTFSMDTEGDATATIINSSGQTIAVDQLSRGENKINVGSLSSGLYTLKLTYNDKIFVGQFTRK